MENLPNASHAGQNESTQNNITSFPGKKAHFRSLAVSLAFAFLGLGALVLTVNNALNIYFNFQKEQNIVGSSQNRTAQDAANTVRQFIEEKFRVLDQATDVNDLATLPDRRELVLNKILGRDQSLRQLLLVDNRGGQLEKASRLSSSIPIHLTGVDMKVLLSTVNKKKNYTSAVYFDEATQEPLVVLAIPAKNVYGDVRGAVIAEVNLSFMWDLVANIKIGREGGAYVVDRQGNLLAYRDTGRVLKRENLSNFKEVNDFIHKLNEDNREIDISKGIQGNYVISSYSALNTPDWAVIVELPVFEAYQSLISETELSILIMIVSVFLGLFVTVYFSRKITRPLISLRDSALKIEGGDLSEQIKVHENNEIGQLSYAFSGMLASLNQKITEVGEERVKLQASIESLTVGFIMLGSANNVIIINETAKKILGVRDIAASYKDLTLQKIGAVILSVDLKGLVQQCLTTHTPVFLKEVPYHNMYLKLSVSPIIENTEAIGVVLLIEDITEAKVLERSKDEFFSIASHELRTPLTAIRGNTSMIKQYYSEQIKDPELAGMVNDIHESSVRLIEIVNDFLDASRLEMGKMEFKHEEFDIIEIAHSVVKEYMTTGSMEKLYLNVDEPKSPLPKVFADKNKVKQVLINLVGNALKFTETGGITIGFEVGEKLVKVLVTDTGKGISSESQNLLFRKFQQAQDNILTRDMSRGTGLGLYISRMMIEGMGGSIKIESSEIGKGTTFSFSIPVASAEVMTSQNAVTQPASDSPPPEEANQPNTPDSSTGHNPQS